jgi:thiosulfate dehydrogenase (quinone) large subunit
MSHEEPSRPTNKLALIYGALLLRLWLAVRAIQTGIEKFSAQIGSEELVKIGGEPNDYGLTAGEKVKVYGLDHYHGVPEPMMKMFEKEPMMLKFGLPLYDKILGPVLILLGLTILLGIASRTSLFLLGLLYISLTWGLVLINQNDGVAWLGTHMVIIAMALMLADHNRFAILKKW